MGLILSWIVPQTVGETENLLWRLSNSDTQCTFIGFYYGINLSQLAVSDYVHK